MAYRDTMKVGIMNEWARRLCRVNTKSGEISGLICCTEGPLSQREGVRRFSPRKAFHKKKQSRLTQRSFSNGKTWSSWESTTADVIGPHLLLSSLTYVYACSPSCPIFFIYNRNASRFCHGRALRKLMESSPCLVLGADIIHLDPCLPC
jgi:hypothetical protein